MHHTGLILEPQRLFPDREETIRGKRALDWRVWRVFRWERRGDPGKSVKAITISKRREGRWVGGDGGVRWKQTVGFTKCHKLLVVYTIIE